MKAIFLSLFFFIVAMSTPAFSTAAQEAAPPSVTEKCPVCGMFVAKYPDWTASITFKDSSRLYFDGPKDLLTYFLHIKKYTPQKSQTDIAMIQVKDYYSLSLIDGQKAYYVTGSDVYGPMGNELIPFALAAAAEEFLQDHKGKIIVKFHEITAERIKAME